MNIPRIPSSLERQIEDELHKRLKRGDTSEYAVVDYYITLMALNDLQESRKRAARDNPYSTSSAL